MATWTKAAATPGNYPSVVCSKGGYAGIGKDLYGMMYTADPSWNTHTRIDGSVPPWLSVGTYGKPKSDGYRYYYGELGDFYRDNGTDVRSWVKLCDSVGYPIYGLEIFPGDGYMYAGSSQDRLLRSTDGGVTWTLLGSLPDATTGNVFDLRYFNGYLYCTHGGRRRIYRTQTPSVLSSWVPCSPQPPSGYHIRLHVHGNLLWAATWEYQNSRLMYSADGTNWVFTFNLWSGLTPHVNWTMVTDFWSVGDYLFVFMGDNYNGGNSGRVISSNNPTNPSSWVVEWSDLVSGHGVTCGGPGVTGAEVVLTTANGDIWVREPVPLPPYAPSDLLVDGVANNEHVHGTAPKFRFTCSDPNGDDLIQYRIEVNTDPSFTGTVMWDSGVAAFPSPVPSGSQCPDIVYAGTPLANGATYYWRARVWDDTDLEGPASTGSDYFVMELNAPPGSPTSLRTEGVPNNNAVGTKRPYFDFVFEDPDVTDHMTFYCMELYDEACSVLLWSSGKAPASTPVGPGERCDPVLCGITLTEGDSYNWRARTWDSHDECGPWSPFERFTVLNVTPYAPTSVWINGKPSGTEATKPVTFSAVYSDPYPPNDRAIEYRVQVSADADFTGRMFWDSGRIAFKTPVQVGERCEDIRYRGYPLKRREKYYVRIKFWDADGNESPWSH